MGGWDKHPHYGGHGGWISTVGGLVLMLIVAFAMAYCSQVANAQPAEVATITGRVTVSDGDTIRFGRMRVRLWGIDAPEGSQRCGDVRAGNQSRAALRALAEGRQAVCSVRDVDRNRRPVAVCTVDGRDLATEMVTQGWAWDYQVYSNGAYAGQEAIARQALRGVHAMACEMPWDLRERLRREARDRQ